MPPAQLGGEEGGVVRFKGSSLRVVGSGGGGGWMWRWVWRFEVLMRRRLAQWRSLGEGGVERFGSTTPQNVDLDQWIATFGVPSRLSAPTWGAALRYAAPMLATL